MPGSLERILHALEASGVRYIVVGGVAVVLHGHLRTTADLDLVIDLEPANARRAIDALAGLGFRPRAPVAAEDFAQPEVRRAWIEEQGLQVFSLWNPSAQEFEVDVFASEPFEFDPAWRRAERVTLGSTEAVVASIDDLITPKLAAGRPEDLRDIEALEALRAARRQAPA
ncbi:MAG: nucleotidyltransferase family protein [Polyangiaceae bacterium]|nr:nucleotidyltransferase family protein [Polyangiaceae bacterium]